MSTLTFNIINCTLMFSFCIFAIFLVVYFVGYWVSSNYYTKISNNFKASYTVFLGVCGMLSTLLVMFGLAADGVGLRVFLLLMPMLGALTLIFGFLHCINYLVVGFHKSRKYFANKRNLNI